MKKVFFVMVSLVTISASAAEVKGGRVNVQKGVIELDVAYAGGCKKHDFSLEVGGSCLESFPVQCSARLIDNTNDDFCEAYIHDTIEISLEKAGLKDPYYSRASLKITGDNDTKVEVRLP